MVKRDEGTYWGKRDNRSRKKRGRRAEDIAQAFLEKKGLLILERNFQWRGGEIDIIAKDGDTLVFIEVRSLFEDVQINPILTIGTRKRERLRKTALHYLVTHDQYQKVDCRFDVVGLLFKEHDFEVIYLKDAFRF